jgi:ribosomal protein L44E
MEKNWVEAFDFLSTEEITADKTQSTFRDGRTYCRLCGTYIEGHRVKHARAHQREMKEHRERKARRLLADRSIALTKARQARARATVSP